MGRGLGQFWRPRVCFEATKKQAENKQSHVEKSKQARTVTYKHQGFTWWQLFPTVVTEGTVGERTTGFLERVHPHANPLMQLQKRLHAVFSQSRYTLFRRDTSCYVTAEVHRLPTGSFGAHARPYVHKQHARPWETFLTNSLLKRLSPCSQAGCSERLVLICASIDVKVALVRTPSTSGRREHMNLGVKGKSLCVKNRAVPIL